MSEEVADLRRQLARMTTQLQRLESASRQTWQFPANPNRVPDTFLWTIIGGNLLSPQAVDGIAKAAADITPSTLPDGPAGTGIVIVPAWPVPIGLPNGIGVAVRINVASGQPLYTFVRIDNTYGQAYGYQDCIAGEALYLATTSYLDKVSGPTTWRYVCLSGIIGFY